MNSASLFQNDAIASCAKMPVWRHLAIVVSLAVALFFTVRVATRPVKVLAATVGNEFRTETRSIEDMKLGMRVVGRNPLRHETSAPSQISPESWRAIHLSMNYQGTEYKLAFLRSTDWLESVSATPGASIHFALPEMGLDGTASVDSIEPCPVIEPDDDTGRMVVTGTMRHLAANIIDLHVSGLEQPIGVTFTHPIWSETRQEFVQAGELQADEKLRTLSSSIAVVHSVSLRMDVPETVFNLEVDGEHVYSIATGLLVHNACPISVDDALGQAAAFMEPGIPIRSLESGSGVQFLQQFMDANGNGITRRVGLDLNPASAHVAHGIGPHLNLQTQINGIPITKGPLADPHILIDPTTIRPGDF